MPDISSPVARMLVVTDVITIPVSAPVMSTISPTRNSSPKFVPVPSSSLSDSSQATVPVKVADGRSAGHQEILKVFPISPAHFAATDAVKLVALVPPKSGS